MKRWLSAFLLLATLSIISIETGQHELGIVLALMSAIPCGISLGMSTRQTVK